MSVARTPAGATADIDDVTAGFVARKSKLKLDTTWKIDTMFSSFDGVAQREPLTDTFCEMLENKWLSNLKLNFFNDETFCGVLENQIRIWN